MSKADEYARVSPSVDYGNIAVYSHNDVQKMKDKIAELKQQIEKLKTELDNARESANRQEQWEIYSVLNDLYNDNFEITKGVSN